MGHSPHKDGAAGAIALRGGYLSRSITMSSTQPSPAIDAALCDLLATLSTFSDDHFDAGWMHLNEAELEALVVHLLQHWTKTLDGRLLAGYLLVMRTGSQPIE